MLAALPDSSTLAFLLLGALAAGFVTGFAGFGTALVASGFWFHVLPPVIVPPMVVIASVTGQLIALAGVRPKFDWKRAAPYLIGGALGVPLGVAALTQASPELLRLSVGVFLICYAASQLVGLTRLYIGSWGGRSSDAAVGIGGGILGGFAGLSGPLPLIWLQLRGGPSIEQRAVYQPFNLAILSWALASYAWQGVLTAEVGRLTLLCLPGTVLGVWLGVKAYGRVDDRQFRRLVLWLLLASGILLTATNLS